MTMAFTNPVTPLPWLFENLWQDQAQGGQAYRLTVYKMAPCPCGTTPGSPPNMSCQACGGTGILYPTPPRQTLGIVTEVTLHTDLVPMGLAQPGDLQVSTRPGQVHLDPFDLVFVPWTVGVPMEGVLLVRGSGPTDRLPYRAAFVEGAWTVDAATGQVTSYQLDQDFTVSGITVTWTGRAPSPGTQYTLRYSGDFEWVVFDPPQQRVAFGVDLGQRALLRKRYILLPNAPPLTLLAG